MTPPASVECFGERERATNVAAFRLLQLALRGLSSREPKLGSYAMTTCRYRYEHSVRISSHRVWDEWIFSARAENIPFATHLFHFSRHVSPLSSARSLEMEASMSAPARSVHACTSKDAEPFLRCVSRGSPRLTRPASPGGISMCADSAVGAFSRATRVAFVY